MNNELITQKNNLIEESNVPTLLKRIRPEWQAKKLITRVHRLLSADPSSACQRLMNAAIHDLRDKIVIAGIDIAAEAAKQNKLPPIETNEDVENYPTAKLIDLAYRMGLLLRSEWRRVHRCYEIRRDLEHEDDEYEAGIEDCVYIFNTCIEVILSRDPIQVIRVKDVRQLVEQSSTAAPDTTLLNDYERAPQPRQEEIMKFLISVALDKSQSDIVQQNAFILINQLKARTHAQVTLKLGTHLQDKIGRTAIDTRLARVAHAAGILPYMRQSSRRDFFESYLLKMGEIGYDWSSYAQHGELLGTLREFGCFSSCPEALRPQLLKWLVLAYIGRPGGVTQYGNVRHVYYSNTASPIIEQIISDNIDIIKDSLEGLRSDDDIIKSLSNQHVARRFENLADLID